MQAGGLLFFQLARVAVEGKSSDVQNTHAQLKISLPTTFLSLLHYCARPVNVHLAMPCVSCLFDSFSVFLLCFTQQQNFMKIMFSCIHFPTWPYPPQIMKKTVFYTGKLYGLTGMVHVSTVILPWLSDPCNFITVPLVTRELEQMTLLF